MQQFGLISQQFGLISLKRTSLRDLQTRLRLSHACCSVSGCIESNVSMILFHKALYAFLNASNLCVCISFNIQHHVSAVWLPTTSSLFSYMLFWLLNFTGLKPRHLGLVCPPATKVSSRSENDDGKRNPPGEVATVRHPTKNQERKMTPFF